MDIVLLKKYLKMDAEVTEFDEALSGYLAAAETYITNAGCKVDYTNKLCEIIIVILVTRMVENPDLIVAKSMEDAGLSVNMMIAQLRLSQG